MSQYRLHIEKPCGENWFAMTPKEQGRLCNSCERVVRDFTSSSRADIWRILHTDQKICGRFTPEQLETSFKNPISHNVATAGIFSLVAAVFASGEAHATTNAWPYEQVSDSLVTLTGIVVDSVSNEPLPYAKLYVDENPLRFGEVSNIDGVFHFQVPQNYLHEGKTVEVEILAYHAQTITLSPDSLGKSLRIEMIPMDTSLPITTVNAIVDRNRETNRVSELNDSNSVLLTGTVYDTGAEEVMPYATVHVQQDIVWYKTMTDFDGKFELRVPNYMVNDSVTLVIRMLGYPPTGVQVVPQKVNEPLKIELAYDSNYLGDVVIIKDTPWLKFKRWWHKLWHKQNA